DHPDGGAITVRDGKYGPYVNWGKVNATLPKGKDPQAITVEEALALITEKAGKAPVGKPARAKAKPKAAAAEAKATKTAAKPKTTKAKAPAKAKKG
ncbi:topoisomerase C-terminal repeat-containing protein, partial [Rhizobium phaseoli]